MNVTHATAQNRRNKRRRSQKVQELVGTCQGGDSDMNIDKMQLVKAMLILHIAIVLQQLGLGSQNEGGGGGRSPKGRVWSGWTQTLQGQGRQ